MKREIKIKLTKICGCIGIIIGILIGIITLLIDNQHLKSLTVIATALFAIGTIFIVFPEVMSNVGKSQTQAKSKI